MKTAMQELIEYMYELNTRPYINGTTFREGAINYAKQLLEKEKEQIINAYQQGHNDAGWTEDKYEPLEYYNQTYNQNK
jgi:hypothetical protein